MRKEETALNLEVQSLTTTSYSKLKAELLDSMDEILGIENISGCACEDLKEKVRSNAFNLVVDFGYPKT